MSTAKILSADGLTEIAEQQISETRNLFFESPTAPSLNSISTTPTNVFVNDAADDAILWADGTETPLTMSVAEASSQGTQTAALSLPENVVSKKLAEVVDVNSVLKFNPTSQTITPESPSIILRNTEGLDGKTTVLPFIKVGAMEVAINGTKLISGVNKENKKITAANYADGSSFSMNLGDNLPNSKLIDIIRAYHESRGAEVNIRRDGGMVINPFANCLAQYSRIVNGSTVTLWLVASDMFVGESYYFSCRTSSTVPDVVRFTCRITADAADVFDRYLEKKTKGTGETEINCRLSFKKAQHQYMAVVVSLTYSSADVAKAQSFADVMLSRSDVLTPYTSDPAETEEQLAMLESMDVAVSYPFATAIAGKPVFWKSWKLSGYNAPAKTVTAGYSSGLTDPVLSVTKNSVGGVDSSAINVGINGKATTGHYLDEKGAPLSGLFFSSRKDLQTSAGFLVKWLFAACSRKLTVTRPRGGSFGEVMEEQGDISTNYYMFAPPAQPLNGYALGLPCVKTSRAFVGWNNIYPSFSYNNKTFVLSFANFTFLGFHTLIVNFEKHKPAYEMPSFAKNNATEAQSWFTYPSGSSSLDDPTVSSAYLAYMTNRTVLKSGNYSIQLFGFSRYEHTFSEMSLLGTGVAPETITLRSDAPCRYVETWLHVRGDASKAYIDILINKKHHKYPSYGNSHALVYIIAFQDGIAQAIAQAAYGQYLRVINVGAVAGVAETIQIGYYNDSTSGAIFQPKLYYYQLNEN